MADTSDSCALGDTGWIASSTTDYDSDGCQDAVEDTDDDNDGVTDSLDSCRTGDMGWTPDSSTDYDSDGCQDSSEDLDDDNDGVNDLAPDDCIKGDLDGHHLRPLTTILMVAKIHPLKTMMMTTMESLMLKMIAKPATWDGPLLHQVQTTMLTAVRIP